MVNKRLTILAIAIAVTATGLSCGCNSKDEPKNPVDKPDTSTVVVPVKDSRNAMTDPYAWMYQTDDNILARFSIYKEIGVNVLRVEYSWGGIEWQENSWNTSNKLFNYLRLAKENGFRVKLILGHLSDPPEWFLNSHKDAYMVSQDGDLAHGAVSFWYEGLPEIVSKKTRKMIETLKEQDLWDVVDFIEPALGCAGEPIYPPAWTQSMSAQKFWCYADNAKADFRAAMKKKYVYVSAANEKWGTSFSTWDAVTVLQPGEKQGYYWLDVLTWYRNKKRQVVTAVIDSTTAILKNTGKVIVINVPGVQYTPGQWNDALYSTAGGASNLMTMEDSDYLLDYACAHNQLIEYTGLTTGVENVNEIARLAKYIKDKGSNVGIWAENVGDESTASRITELQNLVISNRLYGFDYTHSKYMFQDDGVTPIADRKARLKALYSALNQLYNGK
jgi:hypothetical protein